MQWSGARESLRIPLLQPETCGEQGRPRYGDTTRTMLGAADCGRLPRLLRSKTIDAILLRIAMRSCQPDIGGTVFGICQ